MGKTHVPKLRHLAIGQEIGGSPEQEKSGMGTGPAKLPRNRHLPPSRKARRDRRDRASVGLVRQVHLQMAFVHRLAQLVRILQLVLVPVHCNNKAMSGRVIVRAVLASAVVVVVIKLATEQGYAP